MSTTKASLEEYLNTSYRPDVEYIDGELQERNVGEIEHAEMILAVLTWFLGHRQEWQIRIQPDVRVQVDRSASAFRMSVFARERTPIRGSSLRRPWS